MAKWIVIMKIQPSICLDVLRKPRKKNSSQIGQHRNLNSGPPEYACKVLPQRQPARWRCFYFAEWYYFCSRDSGNFFTCCTTIFIRSICHKLHTSFICWCSWPSWSWVNVYAYTTITKTINPSRNCAMVHSELTTNFTQNPMDFCGIIAS